MAQYNSGKKTEDAFAQLAKDNSADNNAKDGGLYENVYPGQMVNSFGNWCFDSSRKSGDVAMVQTDYGYHIMYFVKQTNMPAWKYTAQQAMASSDGDADTKALEKSYPLRSIGSVLATLRSTPILICNRSLQEAVFSPPVCP